MAKTYAISTKKRKYSQKNVPFTHVSRRTPCPNDSSLDVQERGAASATMVPPTLVSIVTKMQMLCAQKVQIAPDRVDSEVKARVEVFLGGQEVSFLCRWWYGMVPPYHHMIPCHIATKSEVWYQVVVVVVVVSSRRQVVT